MEGEGKYPAQQSGLSRRRNYFALDMEKPRSSEAIGKRIGNPLDSRRNSRHPGAAAASAPRARFSEYPAFLDFYVDLSRSENQGLPP